MASALKSEALQFRVSSDPKGAPPYQLLSGHLNYYGKEVDLRKYTVKQVTAPPTVTSATKVMMMVAKEEVMEPEMWEAIKKVRDTRQLNSFFQETNMQVVNVEGVP